jgi:hypothetical protein
MTTESRWRDNPWIPAGLLLALLVTTGTALSMRTQADASQQAHREAIAALSAPQLEELSRKHQRFDKLDPAQQEKLRVMQAELASDPRTQPLLKTMRGYHRWLLETRSPGERQALRRMSSAQRFVSVQADQQHQQRREGSRLSFEDFRILLDWLRDYVRKNDEQILQRMSEQRRESLEKLEPDQRRRHFLQAMIFFGVGGGNSPGGRPSPFALGAEDYTDLESKLSESARGALEQASSPEMKSRVIQGWFRHVIGRHRRGGSDDDRGWDISQVQLEQFFRGLSQRDQDRLLSLSPESFRSELKREFLESQLGDLFRRSPGSHSRPGGRDGSPGRFPDGPPGRRPGDQDSRPDEGASRSHGRPPYYGRREGGPPRESPPRGNQPSDAQGNF